MLAATLGMSLVLGYYSQQSFQPLVPQADAESAMLADPTADVPVAMGEGTALLTRDIAVGLRHADDVALIAAQPGFVATRASALVEGLQVATFTTPLEALAAANALYRSGQVDYAHPDFTLQKRFREGAPKDEPYFVDAWHLDNRGEKGGKAGADVRAVEAWETTTGSSDIIVAILDGGFETDHPDLDGAWAVNRGEIADNDIDDDQNGFVDDVVGWNFADRSNDHDGDEPEHGTSVAGLVGARANGHGVTGVCPGCRMLPVTTGMRPSTDAEAFAYAAKMGADVISNSWGYNVGSSATDVVVRAIAAAATTGRNGRGAVILFAMNNRDRDDCAGSTPDISSLDTVIAVSGIDDRDVKVRDSAWGNCMDVLGPTKQNNRPGIVTTDLTSTRGYNRNGAGGELDNADFTNDFSGTSAATPIVAGVVGLILSVRPDLSAQDVREILTETADKVDTAAARYDASGFSRSHGYGRVNAAAAVARALRF